MRLLWILIVTLLSACASQADVISTDLTKQRGLFVIGYIDNDDTVSARVGSDFRTYTVVYTHTF